MAENESAESYGLDPKKFKILDDPKPVAAQRVPPPTDGVPNLLRGSLPQSVQLPPDFTAGSEYKHIPVFRLTPPQPSGVAGVNSAVQSTSRPISTEAAGVVVGKALPGTVSSNGTVSAATLNNVADGAVRFARESGHSSMVPTTNPITATDAGSSATVSISAFAGQYSGRTVNYGSGSIVALPYSTLLYVYASDPTLNGGAATFLASTSKPDTLGATNGSTANVFVGSINTPASGGTATIGNGDGGSSSNQTGASNVVSVATNIIPVAGGGFGTTTNISGSATVSSGTPNLETEWGGWPPTFNNNFALSRVVAFSWTFTLSSATASYNISYTDGVLGGTIIGGGATASGTVNFTLPAGINMNQFAITATATYSSGAGHATLAFSRLQVLVNS